MYEELQSIERDNLIIQARLHGIEIKTDQKNQASQAHVNSEVPLFGDPSEYKSMSEEDREQLTQKMLQKHKVFAKDKGLKNG